MGFLSQVNRWLKQVVHESKMEDRRRFIKRLLDENGDGEPYPQRLLYVIEHNIYGDNQLYNIDGTEKV